MTNHSQGHEAEQHAARYLVANGYKVEQVNWRTPACEIDIVAKKQGVVYFVEVKYRKHSGQGLGLDYITPTKLKQMQFAAQCWVQESRWNGDYELAALEVTGQDFDVTSFLPNIL